MEDLFKKLFEGEELPEQLKKDVEKTLDATETMLNITSLFTDMFFQSEVTFLAHLKKDDEKEQS